MDDNWIRQIKGNKSGGGKNERQNKKTFPNFQNFSRLLDSKFNFQFPLNIYHYLPT